MSEEVKWYNPNHNPAQYKYRAKAIKRIALDVQKEYYVDTIKPAADKLGLPVNTFVKQAIAEKIERMNQEEE